MSKEMAHLLMILLLVANATADDGKTEIALNVFSDIAPILALFGEQFATQFASQSVTWLDHVLIAMVPLGIITIISGAIRVAGPQWSRAVIGRARESRAVAEVELMSSVSHEVCEMFNGRSFIRAIGKPKVAHFLIFRVPSKESEAKEGRPQTGDAVDNIEIPDIHTIETAHKEKLIEWEPYHSESYKFIKNIFTRPRRSDIEARGSQPESQPERTVDYSNPLNIQLNISTRESGREIYVAGLFAVTLQCGLICIAAITVFHPGVKTTIGVEAEVYGFPCYVAGSVLLSAGIAFCSLAIEQTTEERAWEMCDKRTNVGDYPKLVFLQQDQRVQDMQFDPYVIYAGRRDSIITSNRREEPRRHDNKDPKTGARWDTVTLFGALIAGLGFTAQYIGLRGLTYPCAIAHLLSIILMAATRAFVRRRLGDPPLNIGALRGHELDFLAHHIVFDPDFEGKGPKLVSRWGVKTQDLCQDDEQSVMSRKQSKENIKQKPDAESVKGESEASEKLLLVRKRLGDLAQWKTQASPSALSVAKSIEAFMNTFFPVGSTKSQETVKIDWRLETWRTLSENAEPKQGFIKIPIESSHSTWEVDLGKVAAVLSLWIANIETKSASRNDSSQNDGRVKDTPRQGSPEKEDWRRAMPDLGSSYRFRRLLGHDWDDQLLTRDLHWWVDNYIHLDQSNEHGEHETRGDLVDITIGFNGKPDDKREKPDTNLAEATTLSVTGSGHLPVLLAQHLFTSFIWTVVEKLPSDFLREAEQDVDIVNPYNIDIREAKETRHLPNLRHRKLANLVRRLEGYGLGRTQDILLCMIPALSFADLLPNDQMLRLIPQMTPGLSWVETARCYNNFLVMMSKGTHTEERFTFALVTRTMDFLNLAFEPYILYSDHIKDRDIDDDDELSSDLKEELFGIVKTLSSTRFGEIVRGLAPIYELQNRRQDFLVIFKLSKTYMGESKSQILDTMIQTFEEAVEIKEEFFDLQRTNLGFTRAHKIVCSSIAVERDMIQSDQVPLLPNILQFDYAEYESKGDIFGWTALHYAYLADYEFSKSIYRISRAARRAQIMKPIHECLNKLHQSPLHISIYRNRQPGFLLHLLKASGPEAIRIAIEKSGINGMTALHLAVVVENVQYVQKLTESGSNSIVSSLDIWGRQPLHIAAKLGNGDIALQLVRLGASVNRTDNFGKSAVRNLFQQRRKLIPHATLTEFIQASQRDIHGDRDGKNPFHIAAEVASIELIHELRKDEGQWDENMESQDINGRTPLALAILAGRSDVAQEILRDARRTLRRIEDNFKTIPLMHAAAQGLKTTVKKLFDQEGAKKVDSKGRMALDYALDNNNDEVAEFLLTTTEYEGAENKDTQTILWDSMLASCKNNCVLSANVIISQWPSFINKVDEQYGQTPLSWACEYEAVNVVRALLRHPDIDPNIPAADNVQKYTPLHFAVRSGQVEIVECLTRHPNIDFHARDKWERTPLDIAISSGDSGIIHLLCIAQPNTTQTIKSLSRISDAIFDQLLKDYAISDDDIKGWVNRSVEIFRGSQNAAPLAASLKKASERDIWKKIKLPCHMAAQTGEFSTVKRLLSKGANIAELDEDNWSWVDYGRRYSDKDIDRFEELSLNIHDLENMSSLKKPKGPSDFAIDDKALESINLTPCNTPEHKHESSTLTDIRVMREYPGMDCACIATQNPIVPTADGFYFEMTVIEDSVSGVVGLGFCDEIVIVNAMPGWRQGSWGYHGDDGRVFVDGDGKLPSADFGDLGKFRAGDVAGCGLDMKTGEGFCTLNGKRLEMGNAFHTSKFRKGKIYPCVGFSVEEEDAGLQIQVNFGSEEHPFKYQGIETSA